ncbi:MAG: PAS domain S-box protein, partial [Lacibacter sp.]
GVITHVYPLQGNESVIGFNILTDSARKSGAITTIQKRDFYISGPIHLKQGGEGFVSRVPIFKNDRFWGFSAAVIKLNTLLKAAGIDTGGNHRYSYELRKVNPDTGEEESFFQHKKTFRPEFTIPVEIPNGEWKLYIADEQSITLSAMLIFSLLGILLSVTGGMFAWYIASQPSRLEKLVQEKTFLLQEGEQKYKNTLDRVTDGFAALDIDGNFTYINTKAEQMTGRNLAEMIGRNIWTEFPEGIGQLFYDAYVTAKDEQLHVSAQEYYAQYDRWFELDFYPSTDGMTLFFRDITSKKKAEQEIKESEEKYRTLVEQASDGIFIADKTGHFISVNSSGQQMSQYSMEELEQMTIYDLALKEDLETNPFQLQEMAKGEPVMSERPMRKKDGTIILTEINAKFLKDERMLVFVRDITNRKKTEEEFRQANHRFEMISRTTNDAVWEWNLETGKLWCNETHQQLYGLTMADPVPAHSVWAQRIHPDDRQLILQRQQETLASGRNIFITEYRFLTGENVYRNLYDRCYIIRDKEGKATGLMGSMMDITERKTAEDALRVSEEKYRQIVETAQEGIWMIDANSHTSFVNNRMAEMLGYTKEEMLGKHLYAFMDDEGRKISDRNIERRKQGIAEDHEFKFVTKHGRDVWTLMSTNPVSKNGEYTGALAMVTDITEHKKIENQVLKEKELSDSIINSLPGIFYLFDTNRTFLRWNKNFETVSGYTAEEIREIHPGQFYDDEGRLLVQKHFAITMHEGESAFEADFVTKTGEKIPYYFTGQRVFYEGQPCLIGTGIDIAERKKAEEEVKQTSLKMRQLTAHLQTIREEERKRIGREIHDELGQQLTAIKMDVAWINKKTPNEAGLIKTKLGNIITLLDGSNLSIRKILNELRVGVLDDYGLIDALEWQGNQFTENTGIPLFFKSNETVLKVEEPVATCIFRVFQESLTNITRYAEAKRVSSSLYTEDDRLILEIEDDGKGFHPHMPYSKQSFGILGMQERVSSVNGTFQLLSSPGKGTKIIITVPYKT